MRPEGRAAFALALSVALLAACAPEAWRARDVEKSFVGGMRRRAVAADPIFFRVEAAGGPTVYLLGPIHVGPRRGWLLPPHVGAAFDASDVLALEYEVAALKPVDVYRLDRIGIRAPWGTTLADLVPASTMRDLERFFDEQGMGDVEPFMHHRPRWVAQSVRKRSRLDRNLHLEQGIEAQLLRAAAGVAAWSTDARRADQTFLAVLGAAHLVDQGTVRDLLLDRYGLSTTRIRAADATEHGRQKKSGERDVG